MKQPLLRITSVATGIALAAVASTSLADTLEDGPATTAAAAVTTTVAAPTTVSAKTLLSKLVVAREKHGSTYSRTKFGGWIDANRDCRNTRAEVLRAESSTAVMVNSACTVKTGRWTSKYDGKRYTAATYLDIDHLVPLKEAWTSGASGWSARKRVAFANDLGYGASLIAVSVRENRTKSDQEPTTWLPTSTGYRCTYLRHWVAVKYRWGLSVNVLEKAALSRGLAKYCTTDRVLKPAAPNITRLVGGTTSIPTTKPTAPTSGTTDPRYSTCTAAKAAGANTPYYQGKDAEYAWYSDRDGDGVVCE